MAETDTRVLLDANAIHEMRCAIEQEHKHVWELFCTEMEAHDGFRLGQLREALDQAAGALFNVLNVASSHLGDTDAQVALKRWYGRADEKVAV